MSSLEEKILEGNGKAHWDDVADWILENDLIEELIYYFLQSDKAFLVQRASGVFMRLVNKDKNIFYPFQEILVKALHSETILIPQQRNILRLMQFMYIREEVEGELLDACFRYMENPNLPIAIRVFAMTVAYKIGEKFPEVLPELKILIELNLQMNPSSGLKNRAYKILQKINEKHRE